MPSGMGRSKENSQRSEDEDQLKINRRLSYKAGRHSRASSRTDDDNKRISYAPGRSSKDFALKLDDNDAKTDIVPTKLDAVAEIAESESSASGIKTSVSSRSVTRGISTANSPERSDSASGSKKSGSGSGTPLLYFVNFIFSLLVTFFISG